MKITMLICFLLSYHNPKLALGKDKNHIDCSAAFNSSRNIIYSPASCVGQTLMCLPVVDMLGQDAPISSDRADE